MALGAAPASAIEATKLDTARRMGVTPVNLPKVISTVGRRADPLVIGESHHRLEDARADGHIQHGTPDESKDNGHRGSRRMPVYDANGNLAGIRRVHIARALDN